MTSNYKIFIFLTAFFSLTTFATTKMQITCIGPDVSVVGTLNLSASGELSGQMLTSGLKVPTSALGLQTFVGNYSFIKAGDYYQNFDYEVLTVRAVSTPDILFIKSYVTINGAIDQTVYINNSPSAISCHFNGLAQSF